MNGLRITGIEMSLDASATILETAIEAGHTHGIGYWADVRQIKECELPGDTEKRKRIGWMNLLDHQGAGETDSTEDSSYRQQRRLYPSTEPGIVGINTDHIRRAVEKMLSDPKGTDAEGWIARLVSDEYPDGPMADAIVQVACFGKVIYG